MSSAHFVVTKSPDLQTARVAVSGEIDMSNSGALEKTIADALMVRSVTTLVIDLAELTFPDSSGISSTPSCLSVVQSAGLMWSGISVRPGRCRTGAPYADRRVARG